MRESKLAALLRTRLKIYNNFELLKQCGRPGKDVVVEFQAPAPGRLGWCDFWGTRVWSLFHTKGLKHDPRAIGFDPWHRDFGGPRKTSLPLAHAWVVKNLGLTLVPSPFGGYVPEEVLAVARMKMEKASNEETRVEVVGGISSRAVDGDASIRAGRKLCSP